MSRQYLQPTSYHSVSPSGIPLGLADGMFLPSRHGPSFHPTALFIHFLIYLLIDWSTYWSGYLSLHLVLAGSAAKYTHYYHLFSTLYVVVRWCEIPNPIIKNSIENVLKTHPTAQQVDSHDPKPWTEPLPPPPSQGRTGNFLQLQRFSYQG